MPYADTARQRAYAREWMRRYRAEHPEAVERNRVQTGAAWQAGQSKLKATATLRAEQERERAAQHDVKAKRERAEADRPPCVRCGGLVSARARLGMCADCRAVLSRAERALWE